MNGEERAPTYLDTATVDVKPLTGKQALGLVGRILGQGSDFSAVYVRGKKGKSESRDAWYDTSTLRGISQYESVDALVLVASGHPIYKGELELTPEAFIPQAETIDLQSRGPSMNWSKLHWNNLRLIHDGDAYRVELVGIEGLRGHEGDLDRNDPNPFMQGDFHMELLRQTLTQLTK